MHSNIIIKNNSQGRLKYTQNSQNIEVKTLFGKKYFVEIIIALKYVFI